MPLLPALSAQEQAYLQDTDFLLAKQRILKQLWLLLQETQQQIRLLAPSLHFPAKAWDVSPKISRGENYELLPYLILDYPRVFSQEGVFAYRTMVWWGNEISCTLHLSGKYWQGIQQELFQNLQSAEEDNWWVCVNESPWEYHFRPDNYLSLKNVKAQTGLSKLAEKPFFKLSRKWPLHQYKDLPTFSTNTLQQMAKFLPAYKKG